MLINTYCIVLMFAYYLAILMLFYFYKPYMKGYLIISIALVLIYDVGVYSASSMRLSPYFFTGEYSPTPLPIYGVPDSITISPEDMDIWKAYFASSSGEKYKQCNKEVLTFLASRTLASYKEFNECALIVEKNEKKKRIKEEKVNLEEAEKVIQERFGG